MQHAGAMAQHAGQAFLLWAKAVNTRDWSIVLDAPLTMDSYIAAQMLQQCATYENRMLERQLAAARAKG